MELNSYIGYTQRREEALAKAYKKAAAHHTAEPDVAGMCKVFASWSMDHAENLEALLNRYSTDKDKKLDQSERLKLSIHDGSVGLLQDLHELWLMTSEVNICWTILTQAAKALRDTKLELACSQYSEHTQRQLDWLTSKIKQSASQALTVPL